MHGCGNPPDWNISGNVDPTQPVDPDAENVPTVIAMLTCFSVIGSLGNAVTLIVFSRLRRKQNLTSNIFILTLAATDFVTSVVIIPYTIVMEKGEFCVDVDFVCKLYHGLIVTTVPLSALIMLSIAVDRYLCICHPFSHYMSITRAKVTVVFLTSLAVVMGITVSLCYGVYEVTPRNVTQTLNIRIDSSVFQNSSGYHHISLNDQEDTFNKVAPTWITEYVIKYTGKCEKNTIILNNNVLVGMQLIQSSLYLIVLILACVLYTLIYRRVLERQRSHPQVFANLLCFCIPRKTEVILNEIGCEEIKENGVELRSEKRYLRTSSIKSPGDSRADKIFMANLKIAMTLSVVTIVFIVVYLPAWLMAWRIISFKVIVFYLYFIHNIVNPPIYAFMNPNFRQELMEVLKCIMMKLSK